MKTEAHLSQPVLPLRCDAGDGVPLWSALTSAASSLASTASAVLFGLVSLERADQSAWEGRLNVLVQTVGGVEGV